MRERWLPFDQCIARLQHSFLALRASYLGTQVSFQHPSLRDMLLRWLIHEPVAKRTYIKLASVDGLADIVTGMKYFGSRRTENQHVLVLRDDEEVELLCTRISLVTRDTLLSHKRIGLFDSVIDMANSLQAHADGRTAMSREEFAKTPHARVVSSLLHAQADIASYENNLRYDTEDWAMILERYYRLSKHCVPGPIPAYIEQLFDCVDPLQIALDVDDLYLLKTLLLNERDQIESAMGEDYTHEVCEEAWSFFEECVAEMRSKGEELEDLACTSYAEYEEARGEYEDWESEAGHLVRVSDGLSHLVNYGHDYELQRLKYLVEHGAGPEEPDYEDEDEETELVRDHTASKNYWTIERIFEDL